MGDSGSKVASNKQLRAEKKSLREVQLAVRRTLVALLANQASIGASADSAGQEIKVLVACSGGADSLALAAALAYVAKPLPVSIGAIIVDHQLQAGSDQVAAQAADQCAQLGFSDVQVVAIEVPQAPGSGGLEDAARKYRYLAFTDAAVKSEAQAILLGHTLDDQAETVLLRLTRGSGARSLAGIPHRNGIFYRPMLELRRRDTENVCRFLGLKVWDDPTNLAPSHGELTQSWPLRSRVRTRVLPTMRAELGESVVSSLAKSAKLLRQDDDALNAIASEVLANVRVVGSHYFIDALALHQKPVAVRSRVLKLAASDAGVEASSLSMVHIESMDALITNWHGQKALELPGGLRVSRKCGNLVFERLSKT